MEIVYITLCGKPYFGGTGEGASPEEFRAACVKGKAVIAVYAHIRLKDASRAEEYALTDGAVSCYGDFGYIVIDGQQALIRREEEFFDLSTARGYGDYTAYVRLDEIEKRMRDGVIFEGVNSTVISSEAKIAAGAVIGENVTVSGASVIGGGAFIGSGSRIENSEIGENAKITHSRVESSSIGAGTTVGPYANVHTHSKIGAGCRIGNFVEVKNSTLGDESKAAHLAYVGDADVGRKCNIGCGAIFVNYDGEKKCRSKVGDGAFIGSNCNVIAPVEVSDGAYLAAGSTLTVNLPARALCIARSREVIKEGRSKYKKI